MRERSETYRFQLKFKRSDARHMNKISRDEEWRNRAIYISQSSPVLFGFGPPFVQSLARYIRQQQNETSVSVPQTCGLGNFLTLCPSLSFFSFYFAKIILCVFGGRGV